ncbi:MAG: 2-amino-4-hydroxy-6-hydroxymethyldihydropteridine diphosphokinase, partial [Chloroflexi bacterium]|nr:2-amino-4-hydroxy-6-hydroxymethyldihydropteridine diphosphokinase [Chloroflexota bacterium]
MNVAAMNDLHKVYLNIGSNIEPEIHLPQAIEMLRQHGEIQAISTPWESHAVGGGPNFLNACVLIRTTLNFEGLKKEIVHPIESALGRVRSTNKNAPRTIDVDIIMIDGQAISLEKWSNP